MNWPLAAVIIALVLAVLLVYLSKTTKRTSADIGTPEFRFKLSMESKDRHVSEDDLSKIDINRFYVDSGIGFVIRKPFSTEWVAGKGDITKLWQEKGFSQDTIKMLDHEFLTENPDKNTCLTFLRRGPKQRIKYTAETIVSGHRLEPGAVARIEKVFVHGEELVYDQIVIVAIRKEACKIKLGLLELFVREAGLGASLGPLRLVVNPENTVFLLDYSATFQNIEYNGQRGHHVINNTFLLQENSNYFFEVFLTYVQAGNKPPKVWNELTSYLNSFRVLA